MSDGNSYPGLLDVGFHPMTVGELCQLCVDHPRFSLSSTRRRIMRNLATLVEGLRAVGVSGSLWVDGSFLTEKMDPEDVDLLLYMEDRIYQSFTAAQKDDIRWLDDNREIKDEYDCDCHIHFSYPPGDPRYDFGQLMHSYWHRQYGMDEFFEMKGIAVVPL